MISIKPKNVTQDETFNRNPRILVSKIDAVHQDRNRAGRALPGELVTSYCAKSWSSECLMLLHDRKGAISRAATGQSKAGLARELGISRDTLYRYLVVAKSHEVTGVNDEA